MNARAAAFTLILLAVAGTVVRALVTREGVGVFEYAVGALLVALLLRAALHQSRRALRRS